MCAGAAMVGSAFGPRNPFQAGIALKLAQLPPLGRGGLRLSMFVAGMAGWIALTLRHAVKTGSTIVPAAAGGTAPGGTPPFGGRHMLIMAIVLAPMAAYVYGALRLDWGLNELAGGFLVAGIIA